jgi:hypothetical protein
MQEVLFRRIGNNELTTMQLCRTYVEAPKGYAAKGHDGKARGIYARKFASSVGKTGWTLLGSPMIRMTTVR